MVELELGNIFNNPNSNQEYRCPRFIIALLMDIDEQLNRIMGNIYQQSYDSPFFNTGNSFTELSELFEVYAYNWCDDVEQEYNFIFKTSKDSNIKDIKISWYKHLGRDTTINVDISGSEKVIIDLYDNIIKELLIYEENKLKEINRLKDKHEKLNKDAEWIIQSNSSDIVCLDIKGIDKISNNYIKLYIEDLSNLCEDINLIILNNYLEGRRVKITRMCGGNKNE